MEKVWKFTHFVQGASGKPAVPLYEAAGANDGDDSILRKGPAPPQNAVIAVIAVITADL